MKDKAVNYQDALAFIYGLQRFGIRPGLEVMTQLTDALSRPQSRFSSVLIGGTNGKGSTAAMLSSMLSACGFQVGLYTSPHLMDFTERIRINGEPISRDEAVELITQVRKAAEGLVLPATFFEFATAMAFEYFAQHEVDIAVVEVGLGGRLDATNIHSPLCSVITHISFDHEATLGFTLAKIAGEKAGIVKTGKPLICGVDQPEALEVIASACREKESLFIQVDSQVRIENKDVREGLFDYVGLKRVWRGLMCPLAGEHQLRNAATALAALEVLEGFGFSCEVSSLRQGLKGTQWPGRLELVSSSPFVLLDGAHNPAGACALAQYLAERKEQRRGRLFLMVGILADKNIQGILTPLAALADEVILCRPDYSGSASIDALKLALKDFAVPVMAFDKISEALSYGLSRAGERPEADLLCITGSLYTVGAAKAYLEGKESPLFVRG